MPAIHSRIWIRSTARAPGPCEPSPRLAHEGEQYTPQFLKRFEPLRRYATLVAYLLDMTATLTDTALEMHDHIMGQLFKQGQKKFSHNLNSAAEQSTKRSACMLMLATR